MNLMWISSWIRSLAVTFGALSGSIAAFWERETPEVVVGQTCDILDMWLDIETSYAELSEEDKQTVQEQQQGWKPRFSGFDGNNEDHYGVARHLVNKMGRYQEFKDREMNSHCPMLDSYLAMHQAFEQVRPHAQARNMTVQEIATVLDARHQRANAPA
ncbi:MAG: YfbU family protein [Rhodobacteraceae bacterium]|nr:YfbU family protein [Paracoccaceae bacterium]